MDNNIDRNISDTVDEGKKLLQLVKSYSKMEILDKGSSVLSSVILIIIVLALATIAVFCLCMALYHWLLSKTDDPILSYSIISLTILFLCLVILILKNSIIKSPITRMLHKKLIDSEDFAFIDNVSTSKDIVRIKNNLVSDIKKSSADLKDHAKESFSPKRKTQDGSKWDFNKIVTYTLFAYKGLVWTNKFRRFLGKGKKKNKRR